MSNEEETEKKVDRGPKPRQRAVGRQMLVGLRKAKPVPEKEKPLIILPDAEKRKDIYERAQRIAEVLEQGDRCYEKYTTKDCEVGDLIFIAPYTGNQIPTKHPYYQDYNLVMIMDTDMRGIALPEDLDLPEEEQDLYDRLR